MDILLKMSLINMLMVNMLMKMLLMIALLVKMQTLVNTNKTLLISLTMKMNTPLQKSNDWAKMDFCCTFDNKAATPPMNMPPSGHEDGKKMDIRKRISMETGCGLGEMSTA